MNIREFAKKCGVSIATASRILNYSLEESHASRQTYEAVRATAVRLGYRPNYGAKALHTYRTSCIGIIVGATMPINSHALIKGVTDCTNTRGMSISIASCKNHPKLEAEAFENMLFRGVDAIVWHPIFQRGEYRTRHIKRILEKYAQRVPVVCLSGNNLENVFHVYGDLEKNAILAAQTQLEEGCSEFGILYSVYSVPSMDKARNAYYQTLIKNGVPREAIHQVDITADPAQYETLKEIDGLWCYYMFLLPSLMPQLSKHCKLKRIHVDGQSLIEDYAMMKWLNYQSRGHRLEDCFAKLRYHILDGTKVSRKAAEIALSAIDSPILEPYSVVYDLEIASNQKVDFDNILFHYNKAELSTE